MTDNVQQLNGKVVLITGAGRGLGAGIACGLAQAGAQVCITDINTAELTQTHAEIQADGHDALPLTVDVADFTQMADAVAQTIARWGRLDVLISNAAIMPLVSFAETTPDLWRKMIDVNLTGVYNGVKAVWQSDDGSRWWSLHRHCQRC